MNIHSLLAVVATTSSLSVFAQQRPNIIFLMTDDQSFRSISALGNSSVKTPNLDRLVAKGVTFNSHYATTSISMASRAIVMTGMYEYKTGCNFTFGSLSPEKFEGSYPVLLRENGYFTGFAGKFGFAIDKDGREDLNSYDVLPVDRFDVWGGGTGQTDYDTAKNEYVKQYAKEYPHSSRAYGAFSCDFIDTALKSGKPFNLSVSFKAPHKPLNPDPMFDDVYAKAPFEIPESAATAPERLPKQAKLGRQYMTINPGKKGFEEHLRRYHQQIYGVDYAVGMILDKVEAAGIADNTVIIFTSDNGYSLGEHRLGGKVLAYEQSSRIPLIIVDPRAKAGQHTTSISGNIDMAPTILDYAGVEIPDNMDGKSLVEIVKNPRKEVHKNISLMNVWGYPSTFSLAVVSEGIKYIYWGYGDKMEPTEELFDLRNDPNELKDLSADPRYKAKLEQMRNLYDERLADWETHDTVDNYLPFTTVLSRHIAWDKRKAAIPKSAWKNYANTVKRIKEYDGDPYDYDAVIKCVER